ncbi:MAG: class I SAM-dependent methyltransferase, partial [Planctomycetes bacterium]|nr:class I SAM-dependent methyltransferase [Planctomycetota bacterium]
MRKKIITFILILLISQVAGFALPPEGASLAFGESQSGTVQTKVAEKTADYVIIDSTNKKIGSVYTQIEKVKYQNIDAYKFTRETSFIRPPHDYRRISEESYVKADDFTIIKSTRKLFTVNNTQITIEIKRRNEHLVLTKTSDDKKIKKEAEFWDNKVLPYDMHQKDKRIDKPAEMWDDNEVNNLLRGKYLNEIIMHGREVDGNVLELGSGHGFLCYEISKSNKAQRILGIDISEKRFEHAEKYYNDRKNIENLSEVIFKIDDLNYCNLNEDYYQFIFTWDTLHHILN